MSRLATAVVCLLALLLPAAPAAASTRDKIIKDCADDGVLQGHYSPAALRDARQHLPSDVAEYTDCADVLRRAETPGPTGGGGGAGGAGGAFGGGASGAAAAAAGVGAGPLLAPQTDADRQTLARAQVAGRQPVRINGESIVPGAAGLHTGATRNGMPPALVAALILLSFAGGALTIPGVRKGLPALIGRFRR